MPNSPSLLDKYIHCRQHSLFLIESLSAEDCQLQAMPDVSPMKWHLAHTTWFFDTFILQRFCSDYQAVKPEYAMLFNSYYNGIGEQFARAHRGLLSRPSLSEVIDFRRQVDSKVIQLLQNNKDRLLVDAITLGIAHEQQHQELMLMDILYNFSVNPCFPAYNPELTIPNVPVQQTWLDVQEGLIEVGTNAGFCFDNESPRHAVYVQPYAISDSLVTNAEYLEFINDGGYRNYRFWHSDGLAWVNSSSVSHPLYWRNTNGAWHEFTPSGLMPLQERAPVQHLSFYEAYAYAQYKNARLPNEFEWEHAAKTQGIKMQHCFDSVWQWTQSAYQAYPGFVPFAGNAGEYNGKFMLNQQVLRGGSYLTPKGHTRDTYRNFFYPHQRWVCAGLRLAKDIK